MNAGIYIQYITAATSHLENDFSFAFAGEVIHIGHVDELDFGARQRAANLAEVRVHGQLQASHGGAFRLTVAFHDEGASEGVSREGHDFGIERRRAREDGFNAAAEVTVNLGKDQLVPDGVVAVNTAFQFR